MPVGILGDGFIAWEDLTGLDRNEASELLLSTARIRMHGANALRRDISASEPFLLVSRTRTPLVSEESTRAHEDASFSAAVTMPEPMHRIRMRESKKANVLAIRP